MTKEYSKAGVEFLKGTFGTGLNEVDYAMCTFCFLGIFDDVREDIRSKLGNNSNQRVYNPQFIHTAVIIPCFSMGIIISRQKPFSKDVLNRMSEKKSSWTKMAKNFKRQYNALGLVFAAKLVVEFFDLFKFMTPEDMTNVDLQSILNPKFFRENDDKLYVAQHSMISTNGDDVVEKDRSQLQLKVYDDDKISPIIQLLPLKLIQLKFDRPAVGKVEEESFGRSIHPISDLYLQAFWSVPGKSAPGLEGQSVIIPRAFKPSHWWKQITNSEEGVEPTPLFPENFNYDLAFMHLDSCFSGLDCFTNAFMKQLRDALFDAKTRADAPRPPPKDRKSPPKRGKKGSKKKPPPRSTEEAKTSEDGSELAEDEAAAAEGITALVNTPGESFAHYYDQDTAPGPLMGDGPDILGSVEDKKGTPGQKSSASVSSAGTALDSTHNVVCCLEFNDVTAGGEAKDQSEDAGVQKESGEATGRTLRPRDGDGPNYKEAGSPPASPRKKKAKGGQKKIQLKLTTMKSLQSPMRSFLQTHLVKSQKSQLQPSLQQQLVKQRIHLTLHHMEEKSLEQTTKLIGII